MEKNNSGDVRNIEEGDEVVIETSKGHVLDMTCVEIQRSDIVEPAITRKTTTRFFDMGEEKVAMASLVGPRKSDDENILPRDRLIWNMTREMTYGYAVKVVFPAKLIESFI